MRSQVRSTSAMRCDARVPDEGFDEVARGHVKMTFILRRGSTKEDFDARTGERAPHDALASHADAQALTGGGDWD